MKMDDDRLLSIVDGEFSTAMGAPMGDIAKERANAWKYYLSKPYGNEVEGESQVVTSDVADVVDGIMPSLLRIFTTADNLVSFDPVGPEDEPQAEQESDYISHVFFKKNPAFDLMYTWFFDALVQKNGVVMAYWDESEEVTQESYSGLTMAELSDLLDDDELEPIERAEREIEVVGPDGNPVMGPDGQPLMETVHDVEFRRICKDGRICIENVPPEQYRISADARRLDPCHARMVGREWEVPRTELLEMGFSKSVVDELPRFLQAGTGRGYSGSTEQQARYDHQDEKYDAAREHSMDLILVRECYMKVDRDGDGFAELRHIMIGGNTLLLDEPCDRQPFHVISPQPLPHKHFGRASAEKVMDVQFTTSTLLRQVLQNLYHTNNPQHAVWEMGIGENTLDDLLTTRAGSVKRFARPVGESYAPLTVPFTAGSTFPMLEYFDRVKRDRTGVGSDSEGLSPDALKNIQQSVMSQSLDISRMRIEAVARIFAETGIRSLFLHMREMMCKHAKKSEIVKLRGTYVEVDPRTWRDRRDTTVNVGLGIGTRDTNLMHLEAIWEKQIQMAQGGGMNLTVTPQNMYRTCVEIAKNANYKMPEQFFTNPGDQQAPPPSDQQQELQKAQAEIQQRQQQLDQERYQIQTAKVELDRQKLLFEVEQKGEEFSHKRELDIANLHLNAEKVRSAIASAQNADQLAAGRLELDRWVASVEAMLTSAQTDKAHEESEALSETTD